MPSFEDLDDLRERNKQLLVRLRDQRKRLQCLTAVATDPNCPGSGEIRRRPADSSRHSSAFPVGSVDTEIDGRHSLARTSLSKTKTLDEDHLPVASHKKAQDVSEISTLGKHKVPLRAPSQHEGPPAHYCLLQDERNIDLGRENKYEAMTSGLDFRSVGGDQHNDNSLVRRSTEPLLGYDWIAGMFRYRINSRLFPAPSDFQSACAMCQMPKSQHAHTLTEPAFIRVSVPCAVLLPAHRHRPPHRNSFDPSNSLGLSSHCLLGWSGSAPVAARLPSSLDLRSSLDKVLPEPERILSSSVQLDEEHH